MKYSINLPFKLNVSLPEGDEECDLEIILSGEKSEEKLDEESFESSEEVINLFSLAVNEQMFSKGKEKLVYAKMELIDKLWQPDVIKWKFQYKIKSIPPPSFLVLLALLTQTHYADELLEQVSIRTITHIYNVIDHIGFINMDRNVPTRKSSLPFIVDDSGIGRTKNIDIYINFRNPISTELFKKLEESINIWDHLVILNGFHLDFKEVDEISNFGRTGHISPTTIIHHLDWFDGYSSAFNALINLGVRLHLEGHLLESIIIE